MLKEPARGPRSEQRRWYSYFPASETYRAFRCWLSKPAYGPGASAGACFNTMTPILALGSLHISQTKHLTHHLVLLACFGMLSTPGADHSRPSRSACMVEKRYRGLATDRIEAGARRHHHWRCVIPVNRQSIHRALMLLDRYTLILHTFRSSIPPVDKTEDHKAPTQITSHYRSINPASPSSPCNPLPPQPYPPASSMSPRCSTTVEALYNDELVKPKLA